MRLVSFRCQLGVLVKKYLLHEPLKRLLNIFTRVCRRLDKTGIVPVCQVFPLLNTNNCLFPKVALSGTETNRALSDVFCSEFLDPDFCARETFLSGAVIADQTTVGATVVRRGDGPEPFLPSCVPHIQFNLLRAQNCQLF